MTDHVDVAVIGGGIVGCSVLYSLSRLGVGDIALYERHDLTCGFQHRVGNPDLAVERLQTPIRVEFFLIRGQAQTASRVKPHGLPTFPLGFAVNPDRIRVQTGQFRVVPEEGHVPGRVPG